jgi:hypothetical protein
MRLNFLSFGILNRNGLKTGNGNRWTQERVTSMRSHHRIPLYRPAENGVEPWLNLSQAAAIVGISPKTLRLAAERGDTLSKTARGSSAAPTLTVRPHGASLRGPNATPNTPRDRTRPNKASFRQQHSEMCVVTSSCTVSDRGGSMADLFAYAQLRPKKATLF